MPAAAAAAVALLPIGYLLVRTGGADPAVVAGVLLRERTAALLLRSLALAAAVTACCVLLGTGMAWLTTRTDLPWRRGWAVLAALPLAVPSYVAAYAWVSVVPSVAGFTGSLLVLTACSYPYVYLPVVAALRRADPALEEVSRSLGRGAGATLLTVTARQVGPAAGAGGLLVALYVLSDFGAVSLLRYDVFTRVIHSSYRASFDRTPAAVLSLVLVAATVALTLAERRARGAAETARTGSGAARRAVPVRLGCGTALALTATGLTAAVTLGYPAVVLGYWVVRGSSSGVAWDRLWQAGAATAVVSVLGAVVTVALAVPVGVLVARWSERRGVRLLEGAAYAGHALPGIVVALALVFFGVRFAEPLYQRTPMLVLAYAVLFLPAAVGAVRASVAQSPRRLEEVARSLGSGPAAVLRRVTLPLAGPGVAAGLALVLLTCMKELPATILLRPTGVDTLATRLWTETGAGAYAAAAPYAVVLVAVAALPAVLLGRWGPAGEPRPAAVRMES